ncbi:hypothetical protein, partial [Aeromonas caviae]
QAACQGIRRVPSGGIGECRTSKLNSRLSRLDTLEEKAIQSINLMNERRTALISAAVTGKIDLRGWTPPADEVAA